MDEKEKKKVKKNIPSPIERFLENLTYATFGKITPKWMTPNMITAFGALWGLFGIICAALSRISPYFLIGTIFGLFGHLFCDDLDGYIAIQRNMKSNRGAYFDLLTDILHITYLLIALTFAGVMHWWFSIFVVPVYGIIIFTSMNEIHYLGEFSFPTVGPAETHLFLRCHYDWQHDYEDAAALYGLEHSGYLCGSGLLSGRNSNVCGDDPAADYDLHPNPQER